MAKYYGAIGFAEQKETSPGVWEETLIERKYKGDIIRNTRRYENSSYVNDNFVIDNQFSILADSYAYNNVSLMRYIELKGIKWEVKSIELKYPRLIISVGDVYNNG